MFFDWLTNIYQSVINWITEKRYNDNVDEYFNEPKLLLTQSVPNISEIEKPHMKQRSKEV
jgi:hypothetical protein